MRCQKLCVCFISGSIIAWNAQVAAVSGPVLPGLEQVLAAKRDLWGEAAMKQTNGASYELFENLLPPPRYVHADFRYYPIVLSAPNSRVKARLISDGSGLNLQGGSRSWNAVGTQVMFRVGPDEFKFGGIANRLEHPTLMDGYLPIPTIRYSHSSEKYALEALADTGPSLASNGVIWVRFSLESGDNGIITIQPVESSIQFTNHHILDEKGNVLIALGGNWTWERQRAHARLSRTNDAIAMIATKPLSALSNGGALSAEGYAKAREHCADTWRTLLGQAMNV